MGRTSLKIGCHHILIAILVALTASGCGGGGGGTRPDNDGGSDSGGESYVLGALVIAAVAWGLKKDSSEGGKEKTEVLNMFLVPVSNSVYDHLNYIGDEPNDFGVYTYVLFGRYPAGGESSEPYKKYKAILDIVQEKSYWPEYKKPISTGSETQVMEQDIDTEQMNIYLIPLHESHNQRIVSVSNYDFDFSMRILQRMLSRRVGNEYIDKFNSPGPFLISIPSTIQDSGKQHLLFADFSNVSENMFAEIFASYENSLKVGSNSKNNPFGILENMRIDLGQKLVELNSIFKVIGEAYAE